MLRSSGINRVIKVFTDGGCRSNPGPGAWAFVLREGDIVEEYSGFLPSCTNNQAEYRAFTAACLMLSRRGGLKPDSVVQMHSDSQLVVEQIHFRYKVNTTLQPFFDEAFAAWVTLQDLCQVSLTHVRREFNKEADALCNQVMDKHGVVCERKRMSRRADAE